MQVMIKKTEKQFFQLHRNGSEKWNQIKRLSVLVFFIGLATISNAQFEYGVKVNAGIGCQSDLLELANNCDIRFCPSIGLFGRYQLTEAFALKSGLEYLQKGRSFDKEETKLTDKLNYINLPVKAEFSAGEKAGFKKGQRVFFAVGPYLSYLLDAERELNNVTYGNKENTKDFDFGLSFEIGFEFPVFTDKALQIGLNYDMGLVEIYKTEADLHNKMTSVSFGLLF